MHGAQRPPIFPCYDALGPWCGGLAVPFQFGDAGFLLGDVGPGFRDVPAGAVEHGFLVEHQRGKDLNRATDTSERVLAE
jgi:hypothetical protein